MAVVGTVGAAVVCRDVSVFAVVRVVVVLAVVELVDDRAVEVGAPVV